MCGSGECADPDRDDPWNDHRSVSGLLGGRTGARCLRRGGDGTSLNGVVIIASSAGLRHIRFLVTVAGSSSNVPGVVIAKSPALAEVTRASRSGFVRRLPIASVIECY